ncbi:unnamed protein product [Parascedosporium putredinis]|uniref:Uncharacterized protein n=1 Tax=Parascedosporium putredinis TaxID=1442378 RepID=A0A9P1H4N0_9PEZI|nr:unnamed protein product [Parascedosporium putredinis]CAI7996765.1 unnamed protein product [Parascedosporium putredinis]
MMSLSLNISTDKKSEVNLESPLTHRKTGLRQIAVHHYHKPLLQPGVPAAFQGLADAPGTEEVVAADLDDVGTLVLAFEGANFLLAKATGGKMTELYHHFDTKADIFPLYLEMKYLELAAKTSCIHTGYFFTSYNILPEAYFKRDLGIEVIHMFDYTSEPGYDGGYELPAKDLVEIMTKYLGRSFEMLLACCNIALMGRT